MQAKIEPKENRQQLKGRIGRIKLLVIAKQIENPLAIGHSLSFR
jgi:hypothetical protein